MSITSALGLGSGKKVRYGLVGLGDITQEALLPGVAHTGNSVVTAVVSGDLGKAEAVAKRWSIEHVYGYDRFDALLESGEVDALYIATPNWRHAEFAIPALERGIHVLCEKPLDISTERCRAMMAAARRGGAKLMTAYRLHFEPATLDAITRIRSGELGDLIAFTSCFGQMVDPANHRATNGIEAGPLFDMGAYPIYAARYLFGAEPLEVVAAVGTRHPESGLGDLDDTVAVTLRFSGNRLAQFTVSYYMNAVDSFIIAGTEGSIHMSPGYGWQDALEQNRTIGETKKHEAFRHTDQFGGAGDRRVGAGREGGAYPADRPRRSAADAALAAVARADRGVVTFAGLRWRAPGTCSVPGDPLQAVARRRERRRRMAAPAVPTPRIMVAQVAGSGTAVTVIV